MRRVQSHTRFTADTMLIATSSGRQLFATGYVSEVSRRPAYVMNVSFKPFQRRHVLRFANKGLMTSVLNNSSLMAGNGTEMAMPEAAALTRQTELNLLQSRHAAVFIVIGMPTTRKRQFVNSIHFRRSQWLCRRSLHDKPIFRRLNNRLSVKRVLLFILNFKSFGKFMLIRFNLFIRRAKNGILNIRRLTGHIANAANIVHFRRRFSFRQRVCYLSYRMFTHTVAQNIGLTVQEHGMTHLIGPIIVMSKSSETRFNPADNDGYVFIGFTHAVGVYNRRPFGTPAGLPARRITVRIADFLGSRFFTEHRIEVSRRNQNTQTRLAENLKRLDIVPIRLRNKAYTITAGFQHAPDQSRCKTGVIHIGIPVDIYKVKLIPAAFFHILTTCYQKFRTHRLPLNN